MSPQLQVLKCFKCSTFQVYQVKKSIKWQCKICGDKQSVKRNFGVGTGKECRLHVQKLNSLRGIVNEIDSIGGIDDRNEDILPSNVDMDSVRPPEQPASSKWLQYVEEPEVVTVNDANVTFQGAEVVLELPRNKRKRKNAIGMLPESRQTPDTNKPGAILSGSENISTSDMQVAKKLNSEHWCDSKTDSPLLVSKANIFNELIKVGKTKPDKNITVTPKVAKNSKWAKYIEDSAKGDAECEDVNENFCNSVDVKKFTDVKSGPVSRESTRELFSLCSDDDIDHLLDL